MTEADATAWPCRRSGESVWPNLSGPAGALEARLECPADEPPHGLAVVCHPHPLYGGTMLNKVVHTVARCLSAHGYAALRFNYRGVGRSAGRYADGLGETDDAVAMIDWLQARHPELPLVLAGFSFGAFVALRAIAERPAAALITVAPPVRMFEFARLNRPDCPWLLVQGDADEIVDAGDVFAWADALEPPPQRAVIAGGGHFFHGRLVELGEVCGRFIDNLGGTK